MDKQNFIITPSHDILKHESNTQGDGFLCKGFHETKNPRCDEFLRRICQNITS